MPHCPARLRWTVSVCLAHKVSSVEIQATRSTFARCGKRVAQVRSLAPTGRQAPTERARIAVRERSQTQATSSLCVRPSLLPSCPPSHASACPIARRRACLPASLHACMSARLVVCLPDCTSACLPACLPPCLHVRSPCCLLARPTDQSTDRQRSRMRVRQNARALTCTCTLTQHATSSRSRAVHRLSFTPIRCLGGSNKLRTSHVVQRGAVTRILLSRGCWQRHHRHGVRSLLSSGSQSRCILVTSQLFIVPCQHVQQCQPYHSLPRERNTRSRERRVHRNVHVLCWLFLSVRWRFSGPDSRPCVSTLQREFLHGPGQQHGNR
jgi:hypothetical protein